MGKYSKEGWYLKKLKELKDEFGDIPPPWVYSKDSHPYCIQWRMGAGETLLMVFNEWWEVENKTEKERIEYFKKWPAPPRWLAWMADTIWNLNPWESDSEFDYQPCFAKLKELGFAGTEDYESDLDDEKWLDTK